MSRFKRLCLVLIATVLMGGCSTFRNVVYTQDERRTEQPAFFMDRRGDLYPSGDVYVSKWGVLGHRFKEANLEAHFRRQARRQSPDWQQLLRSTGVQATGNFESDWNSVQNVLVRRAAETFKHEGWRRTAGSAWFQQRFQQSQRVARPLPGSHPARASRHACCADVLGWAVQQDWNWYLGGGSVQRPPRGAVASAHPEPTGFRHQTAYLYT